jgi:hypothetical protein
VPGAPATAVRAFGPFLFFLLALFLITAPAQAQPATDPDKQLDECLGDGYYPLGPPTCTFDSEGNLIDRDIPGEEESSGGGSFLWIFLLWSAVPLAIGIAVASSQGWNLGFAILILLVFGWIGLLFLALVPQDRAEAAAAHVTSEPHTNSGDVSEQIRQLGALRDEGLLTEEEFQAKKAELLASI